MTTQLQPGWYPDPSDPRRQIYWNGSAWSAPIEVGPRTPGRGKRTAVSIGVCILAVIGLFMSMQSVSLLTGSGPIWIGVAVVAAGAAISFFLGAANWARILTVLILALSLANAFYMENQLSQKRDELTRVFDN